MNFVIEIQENTNIYCIYILRVYPTVKHQISQEIYYFI